MSTFAIARALIVLALVEGISCQCWEFDSSFSGWSNSGFQQAPDNVPDITDIPSYDPPTAYAWLQDQTSPPTKATLTSPTITIDEDDLITATFYRHVEEYDGADRINLTFYTGNNNREILFTTNYDVWDTVSVHCGPTGLKCCPTYPCNGYFEIGGYIAAENELVAVSHIGINCLVPDTTHGLPTKYTTPELESTTLKFSTVGPTVESTTRGLPTRHTTPQQESTTAEQFSTVGPTVESTTRGLPTRRTTSQQGSSTTAQFSTEGPTVESTTRGLPTRRTTPQQFSTETSYTEPVSTEFSTSASGGSTTLSPTYCCTFDYNVCDWSLEYVSNGWHWSANKKPDLLPPFSSEYIWLQDASAGVGSAIIPNVGTGTTFTLSYFYMAGSTSGELVKVYYGNVLLGSLNATGLVETFTYTCGSECCDGATTCSAQFRVDVLNQPGISLTISIDSFHVDDATCI